MVHPFPPLRSLGGQRKRVSEKTNFDRPTDGFWPQAFGQRTFWHLREQEQRRLVFGLAGDRAPFGFWASLEDRTGRSDERTKEVMTNMSFPACVREDALKYVGEDPANLLRVPWLLWDEGLCRAAVEKEGRLLALVPQSMRSRGLCRAAVQNAGLALEHVPDRFRDYELCTLAVKNNGLALRFVPEELRDWSMSRQAVHENGRALEFVPQRLRFREICAQAAKNGAVLDLIPDAWRDRDMYEGLLRSRSILLCEVPERMRDGKMCELGVRLNGTSLGDVPPGQRTRKLCDAAVATSGAALMHVPQSFRTKDMCMAAIASFPWAYRWVPESLKDDRDLCLAAVGGHGSILRLVPERARDEEVCLAALNSRQGGEDALGHVPGDVLDSAPVRAVFPEGRLGGERSVPGNMGRSEAGNEAKSVAGAPSPVPFEEELFAPSPF